METYTKQDFVNWGKSAWDNLSDAKKEAKRKKNVKAAKIRWAKEKEKKA